jgi:hypothetical protein
VNWDKIPGLSLIKRVYGYDPNGIEAALKNPKQYALIEVGNPAGTTHWMWAWSKTIFGDWKVADPWTGKEILASSYKHSLGPIIGSAYLFQSA